MYEEKEDHKVDESELPANANIVNLAILKEAEEMSVRYLTFD